MANPEPQWQPISVLPAIALVLAEQSAETDKQLVSLKGTCDRPAALDSATIENVVRVYSEQATFVDLYLQQLERWKGDATTELLRGEVYRLEGVARHLSRTVDEILSVASTLAEACIDRVMEKNDIEQAIDFLSSAIQERKQVRAHHEHFRSPGARDGDSEGPTLNITDTEKSHTRP